MARYIDAEKLLEAIKHLCWVNKACEKDAIHTIKKQPTADVVEVVKCKDCKYNGTSCRIMDLGSPNDFCSNGERSETE